MKLQDEIKEFAKKNKLLHNPETHALDLAAEFGEVTKEILKSTEYGKKQFQISENMKSELGDTFYSLMMLAISCDIDLEEALKLVLAKYKKRLDKGGAGSEFE